MNVRIVRIPIPMKCLLFKAMSVSKYAKTETITKSQDKINDIEFFTVILFNALQRSRLSPVGGIRDAELSA